MIELLKIITALADIATVATRLTESAQLLMAAQAEGRELTAAERAELLSDDDEAALQLYAAIARSKARDQG